MSKIITKIPLNWQQVKLTDVFDFIQTCSHSKDKMSYEVGNEDGVYNIHYGDIHALYNDYVDFYKDTVPFLLDRTECIPEDKFLKEGDLVMVDASEDYDGVGASIEIKNIDSKKCIAGLHVFALRDKSNMTVSGYRRLSVSHPLVRKRLKQISTYSKVYGISKTGLSKVNLILPPLPEQHRIVTILETWDNAIDLLKQKIALKKQVKKGLMQKLLTGDVRLPGFSGEWKTVKLGSVGNVITGNTPPMKAPENYGQEYCWATAEDFKEKYIFNTKIKMTEKGKNLSRFLPKGAVLVTCIASIGKNAIAGVPLATNQQINAIVVNEKNDNEFIYYLIQCSTNLLKRYAGAGALLILNKSGFESITLILPDLEEQQAIASILITSDDEIDLIEQKLHALERQKKFLLNNLVTGNIRTPGDMKVTA